MADLTDGFSCRDAMLAPTFSEEELIELEILRDEEIDTLVNQGYLVRSEQWNPEFRNGFVFTYPEMILEITTGERYPVEPIDYHLKNTYLPRVVIDDLRIALRHICMDGCRTNNRENWTKRGTANSTGIFEFDMVVLHIVTKTVAHLVDYRSDPTAWGNKAEASKRQMVDRSIAEQRVEMLRLISGIDLSSNTKYLEYQRDAKAGLAQQEKIDMLSAKTKYDILNTEFGLNLASIGGHDLANSLLRKTPDQICAKLPNIFRILHIECVIRSDLSRVFLQKQNQLRNKMMAHPLDRLRANVPVEIRREFRKRGGEKEKESLTDYLVDPRLTFHGTRKDYVASIVRQGFLLPEKKEDVCCGSTYGMGLYSSPNAEFALRYTGFSASPTLNSEFSGLKLIVCATIMGISSTMFRDDNWRDQTEPYPGADSHVANEQYEYVVFDQAQILPCYVIHLDLGRHITKYFEHIPVNPRDWIEEWWRNNIPRQRLNPQALAPGDKQRIKEALVAKASKYFSYGYGPVAGSKIIIEEVGEVDEDEEEYGEYQEERVERVEGKNDIWKWDDDNTFAVEEMGEGVDDDEISSNIQMDKAKVDDVDEDHLPVWALGAKGKSKFDEYYDARIAKNKRPERPNRAPSP